MNHVLLPWLQVDHASRTLQHGNRTKINAVKINREHETTFFGRLQNAGFQKAQLKRAQEQAINDTNLFDENINKTNDQISTQKMFSEYQSGKDEAIETGVEHVQSSGDHGCSNNPQCYSQIPFLEQETQASLGHNQGQKFNSSNLLALSKGSTDSHSRKRIKLSVLDILGETLNDAENNESNNAKFDQDNILINYDENIMQQANARSDDDVVSTEVISNGIESHSPGEKKQEHYNALCCVSSSNNSVDPVNTENSFKEVEQKKDSTEQQQLISHQEEGMMQNTDYVKDDSVICNQSASTLASGEISLRPNIEVSFISLQSKIEQLEYTLTEEKRFRNNQLRLQREEFEENARIAQLSIAKLENMLSNKKAECFLLRTQLNVLTQAAMSARQMISSYDQSKQSSSTSKQ